MSLGTSVDHLDENQILELLAGRLGRPALAAADAHLDGCRDCREWLAELAREAGAAAAAEPESPLALAAGAEVGRYRLLSPLPGPQDRWLAQDPVLERPVCLTVLRTRDARERDAALARALLAAQLTHPNLIRVHDAGLCGGRVYVVAEAPAGQPLGPWLAQRGARERLLAFAALADALLAAHRVGCAHGQLSEDQLWMEAGGTPRLAGLGQLDGTTAAAPEADVAALHAALRRCLGRSSLPRRLAAAPARSQALAVTRDELARWARALSNRRRVGAALAAGLAVVALGGGSLYASRAGCEGPRPALGEAWGAQRDGLSEALASQGSAQAAAEARWDLALAHSRLDRPGASRELENASWWAEAARRADLAALSWLELARRERLAGRPLEAERALRYAQAAVARMGDPSVVAALNREAAAQR